MIIQTNWVELGMKSPVPMDDIINIASTLQTRLNAIKQGRRDHNQIMEMKTSLEVLIRALLSLLHKDEIITNKADMEIFMRLQENFGRLLKILEEKDEWFLRPSSKISKDALAYISEIESILYGDIYYTLKRAIERNPKDKRELLYNIYEILTINVGVFGSESRMRGKSTSPKIDTPITAKTAMSEDGQKKLEKDFDLVNKGFENLKLGRGVFGAE